MTRCCLRAFVRGKDGERLARVPALSALCVPVAGFGAARTPGACRCGDVARRPVCLSDVDAAECVLVNAAELQVGRLRVLVFV